jgi:hypothetical protein
VSAIKPGDICVVVGSSYPDTAVNIGSLVTALVQPPEYPGWWDVESMGSPLACRPNPEIPETHLSKVVTARGRHLSKLEPPTDDVDAPAANELPAQR